MIQKNDIDIIGDVHGHLDALQALLKRLGYRETQGAWRHPGGRSAVFVGDLIDRGPEQAETVALVRRMTEAGTASCIMGNHEFNALAFAFERPLQPGVHYRRRRGNTVRHHQAYLDAVGYADSPLHKDHQAFFLALPLFVETATLRITHACWHPASVALLKDTLGPDGVIGSAAAFHALLGRRDAFDAAEKVCKGLEIRLPEGISLLDAQGSKRKMMRSRWWIDNPATLRDVADADVVGLLPEVPVPAAALITDPDPRPVIFGHYWMTEGQGFLSNKRLCVDLSVARGGPLAAYRFDGEENLLEDHIVTARP